MQNETGVLFDRENQRNWNTLVEGVQEIQNASYTNASQTQTNQSIILTTAHFKGLSLHVVFMLIPMLHNFKREQHAAILADLATIIESGALTPVLDEKQFSLAEADQAHARLESGEGMGKVVVVN